MSEFPDKNWKRSSLDKLLKKIQQTGMVQKKKGSGRPKTARTTQNVSAAEELALSQESQPNTHRCDFVGNFILFSAVKEF